MIVQLNDNNLEAFKAYCRKYKTAHDESYLYDEDIDDFKLGDENPTNLLMKDHEIVGVISLMYSDYFIAGNKTRVRIFHCVESDFEAYKTLLASVMPLHPQVKAVEMFLPNSIPHIQKLVEGLNFEYYRTSYVMIRKNKDLLKVTLPDHYRLKAIETEEEKQAYCDVRNVAFKNLKGSETPITTSLVTDYLTESYLFDEGMQVLYHHDQPVGVLRMIKEDDESGQYSFVAPIAVIPSYQGKGLGKLLLKIGIEIGQKQGYNDCMLVVNAENEKALSLYEGVGFETDMAVSCYKLMMK